jgi:hypothetical protein
MSKKWRFEGWKLPAYITDKSCKSEAKEEQVIFEAGADAMLQSSRDSRHSYHPNSKELLKLIKSQSLNEGRWVFIPDDK